MTGIKDVWTKLSLERLELFRNEIVLEPSEEGGLFGPAFLENKYIPLLQSQMNTIETEYFESYKSLDGKRLLTPRQIRIHLLDSYDINASIKVRPNTVVTDVYVTAGMFINLDILSSEIIAYDFGNIAPDIDLPSFNKFCTDLAYHGASRIGHRALFEFYKILKSCNFPVDSLWAEVTSHSLYWLISHEIGHYACGHVGYLQYRRKLHFDAPVAQHFDRIFDGQEFINDIEFNDSLISLCAEFMADAYATIRLLLLITHENRASKAYRELSDVERGNDLRETAQKCLRYCFVPSLIMHNEKFFDSSEKTKKYRSHPPALARYFNMAATVDYFMRPVSNSSNDLRDNPARDYVTPEQYPPHGPQRLYQSNMKVFEGYLYFHAWALNTFERLSFPVPKSETQTTQRTFDKEKVTNVWIRNIFIARQGITDMSIDDATHTAYSISLQIWGRCMRLLCTNVNMRFSWHIPKGWVSFPGMTQGLTMHPDAAKVRKMNNNDARDELLSAQDMVGGFVSDPAYKIFDDWMSNIYHCAINLSHDEIRHFQRQETNIAELVSTDVWKAAVLADPTQRIHE